MKVIKRDVMPDGTCIQIEDWSKDYTIFGFASHVAAYPKNRYAKKFRACRCFNNAKEAQKAFDLLRAGRGTLMDYNFESKECGRDVPYQNKI